MKKNLGYTLTELVITIGLITTFLGFITISLVSYQRRSSLFAVSESLISDFRYQQMKAMVGDTEVRTSPDNYGVYFDTGSYTLFHGTSYSASDSSNFQIVLDPQFQFSPSGRSVIFTRLSGKVSGYSALQNSVTLQDLTEGRSKTLIFNQYGIPVSFQ